MYVCVVFGFDAGMLIACQGQLGGVYVCVEV